MVLRRVAELTNIVLAQGQALSELRTVVTTSASTSPSLPEFTELRSMIAETTRTTTESVDAMTRLETKVDKLDANVTATSAHGMSFGLPTDDRRRASSGDRLTVPSLSGLRSGSLKRMRSDDPAQSRLIIGTATDETNDVPVVAKTERSRIFISRIAPEFTAEAMFNSICPRIKGPPSVTRLTTNHSSYSSFVLHVPLEDENILLSPSSWKAGTLIKTYRGRLHRDQIHSVYEGRPGTGVGILPVIDAALASTSSSAAPKN